MARKILHLTRDQLGSFLTDFESIKQFEQLFAEANAAAGSGGDDGIQLEAASASISAQEALDSIDRINQTLGMVELSPVPSEHTSTETDYIDLPINSPHVTRERRIQWNTDDGTIDVGLFNGVTLQVGQEIHFYAKNDSGVDIPNGASVMATGAVGVSGKITIAKAVADGSISGDYMLGIATQEILDNEFGYVTAYGQVRGIDTTGTPYGEVWADGDIIYFSHTTPGDLTKVAPDAPNLRARMAIVTNAAPGGAGSLYVRAKTGETLIGLNDVYASSPWDLAFIQWNNTNSRWENGIVYKDIIFPIIPKFTGVGNPSFNAFKGGITAPQFLVNDSVQLDASEFIHEWEEGTEAQIHVHFTSMTNVAATRGIKWEVGYTYVNTANGTSQWIDEVVLQVEQTIPANTPAYTEFTLEMGRFTPASGKIGGQIRMRLKRILAAGTAPATNPFVSQVGVHLKCNTAGSRSIATK